MIWRAEGPRGPPGARKNKKRPNGGGRNIANRGLFNLAYHDLLGGGHDVRGVETVLNQQVFRLAAFTEGVFCAHILDGDREVARGDLGDAVPQPTDDVVLFGGDGAAGLFDGGAHGFHVQGLDRVDVDQLDAVPFLLEDTAGFDGLPDQVAAGKNGDVLAFGQLLRLADLEHRGFRCKVGP